MSENKENPILFFDGVCGLCNGFVNFLFKIDKDQVYRVAALQGETAKKMLKEERIKDLNTLVVHSKGKEYIKSEAVFKILSDIGGFHSLLLVFKVFPRFFRDFIYDCVAMSRYSVFGKLDTCRLPTPDEKSRFLD